MAYFYDLHCHTSTSSCSVANIKSIVKMAKRRGVDGVAITDHNKLYNGPTQIEGIDIIPGIEVSTVTEDHVLAYYVDSEIERGQNFQQTIESVRNKGGYSVWAHPLRDEDDFTKEGVKVISLFDGLESGNAMNTKREQELVSQTANNLSLLKFAGSDAHISGQVGMAVVKVSNRLNKENFLEELQKSEIIIRKEIKTFRERNIKWKRFIGFNKKLLNAEKHRIIKYILVKVFLRNYLRINNIFLKKIDFNHKKEAEKLNR